MGKKAISPLVPIIAVGGAVALFYFLSRRGVGIGGLQISAGVPGGSVTATTQIQNTGNMSPSLGRPWLVTIDLINKADRSYTINLMYRKIVSILPPSSSISVEGTATIPIDAKAGFYDGMVTVLVMDITQTKIVGVRTFPDVFEVSTLEKADILSLSVLAL